MTRGFTEFTVSGRVMSLRLGLAEIEELEAVLDMSVLALARMMLEHPPHARLRQCQHVIRLGLIGGGMDRARALVEADGIMEAQRPGLPHAMALQVLSASLSRLHGEISDPPADGEVSVPQRFDFGSIYGAAVTIGVQNVGRLSLAEWNAAVQAWNRAHGDNKPKAPTDEEFEAALATAGAMGP